MAKKTTLYASALVGALEGVSEKEQRTRIARLKNLLKKRGDTRLLSALLYEFAKMWAARKGTIALVVSAGPPSFLKAAMQKTLKKKGYQVQEKQDPALLGGSAVFLGNEYLVDNSVRGKLRKMQSFLS